MNNFIKTHNQTGSDQNPAYWFIFMDNNILVKKDNDQIHVPLVNHLSELNISPKEEQCIGTYKGNTCYTAIAPDDYQPVDGQIFHNLRALFTHINPDLFMIAGYAAHLSKWDNDTKFCGRCGNLMELLADERAKKCHSCGMINYPRISPAVIVAVIKDDKILLANSPRFRSKLYSVLAGFVDVGESLEECIHREIKEEVNIEVQNIRYFGSQPWPFPDSLMIGYIADYKSGEIQIDDKEIGDANWYSKENLPEIPGKPSIAGELIQWFIKNV